MGCTLAYVLLVFRANRLARMQFGREMKEHIRALGFRKVW